MEIERDDSREIDSRGKPILVGDEKKEIVDREFDEER